MSSQRLAAIALATLLATAGCRAPGIAGLRRPGLAPATPELTADVRAVVDRHNRNAELVDSLTAKPSVKVTSRDNRRVGPLGGGVSASGRLAIERPRNLSLKLGTTVMRDIAELGANDNRLWFSDSSSKTLYFGEYQEIESLPGAAAFQPEWIFEALGLQSISADAVAKQDGDRLVLTESRDGFTKDTIFDVTTSRIVEHRLYSADRKQLLARASIPDGYQEVAAEATDPGSSGTIVTLPRTIELTLPSAGLELGVKLEGVAINPVFTEQQRTVFIEPDKSQQGYARRNLREQIGGNLGSVAAATPSIPPGPVEGEPDDAPAIPKTVRLSSPAADETDLSGLPEAPTAPRAAARGPQAMKPKPTRDEEVIGSLYPRGTPAPETRTTGWRPKGFEH